MIFITTLNRQLAKQIKSGKLSEEELMEVYERLLTKYRELQKDNKYVYIALGAIIVIAYMYAILSEGYNLDIFEIIGVSAIYVIVCYLLNIIMTRPIKWKFQRIVKKGYPHLEEQFKFRKESK